jgi:hypothetical protein
MFNFINIDSFIPLSGCVGMGTSAQLCPASILLLTRPWTWVKVICLPLLLRRHTRSGNQTSDFCNFIGITEPTETKYCTDIPLVVPLLKLLRAA